MRVEAKQKILVRRHLDSSVSLWNHGKKIPFHHIEKAEAKEKKGAKKGHDSVLLSNNARKNKHKSPWGKYNPEWIKSPHRKSSHAEI